MARKSAKKSKKKGGLFKDFSKVTKVVSKDFSKMLSGLKKAATGIEQELEEIRGLPEVRAERRERLKELLRKVHEGIQMLGEMVPSPVMEERREVKPVSEVPSRLLETTAKPKTISIDHVDVADIGDVEVIRIGDDYIVIIPPGKEAFLLEHKSLGEQFTGLKQYHIKKLDSVA